MSLFCFWNIRGLACRSKIAPRMLCHGFWLIKHFFLFLKLFLDYSIGRHLSGSSPMSLSRVTCEASSGVGYSPLITESLKLEPCNLTTLATGSGTTSLLSRPSSLVMGTDVHEKVTSSRKQGMGCDEHGQDGKCCGISHSDPRFAHLKVELILPPWTDPLVGNHTRWSVRKLAVDHKSATQKKREALLNRKMQEISNY